MSWTERLPDYIKACLKYEVKGLTEKQQIKLMFEARNGNKKSMDRLLKHHMRFMVSNATIFEETFRYRVPMEDLLQSCMLGLTEAIMGRYSPGPATLRTYSFFLMRKYCFEELQETGYPLHKPRHKKIKLVYLNEAARDGAPHLTNWFSGNMIEPDDALDIAREWHTLLETLTDSIEAMDDKHKLSIMKRDLEDGWLEDIIEVTDKPVHRTTLWRKHEAARSTVLEAMAQNLGYERVKQSLRLINARRHRQDFSESLNAAEAA